MSYIKGINRNQTILFPEVIEDYINEDNHVRFIDTYVDNLDLTGHEVICVKSILLNVNKSPININL